VPVWMAAMTAFYGSIRSFRNMVDEILKVDSSITELKRVASSTINIDEIFQGSVDLSKELGNNIHDIMQAVNDLARTYGTMNERQLLAVAKTATLMANVSDLNVEEATQTLVGTMNAFNISAEDSVRIVDSLNEVDNDYAISTKQLAEGLQKSASTAKTFGVSMEESAGHITAIGAVTMESGRLIGKRVADVKSFLIDLELLASYEEGQQGASVKVA
jgi:TP901 family phage tail tape measure protein